MELRNDDVTSHEAPVVEEPPYRMVPGHDRVCTRDVLRRFNRSMKMQPSPTQQRKKCCWERGQVNGYQITDFLKRRAGVLESNITSGEPGIHTMYVGRISEAHIRWCGHRSEEDQRLEQFAKILRDLGYTVVLAEENNVDWPPNQPRKFLNHRRNRKFLRVAKFHRKQRQKKA